MKTLKTFIILLGALWSSILAYAADPAVSVKLAHAPEASTYQLRNQQFGDLLRPQDANSADGTLIVLYPAQPWKCMTWRLQPAGGATFQVQNLFTAKTFAPDRLAETRQSAVVQVPFKSGTGDVPAWSFTQLKDGSYKIIEPQSGQALTAVKGEKDSQIRVVMAAWQELNSQKWELQKMDPKQLTM